MGFTCRRVPAIALARQLVAEGRSYDTAEDPRVAGSSASSSLSRSTEEEI
mgnify:CR=1 FL=1